MAFLDPFDLILPPQLIRAHGSILVFSSVLGYSSGAPAPPLAQLGHDARERESTHARADDESR